MVVTETFDERNARINEQGRQMRADMDQRHAENAALPRRLDGLLDDLLPCGHYLSRPVYAYSPVAGRVAHSHYECDTCRPSEQDAADNTSE